ncbi:MAG: alpha/beta hydrolase, partial [Ruminococcaceae bacterium]|nr:alpha/beta hydrolase [Oscillospiraceae bacterium]
GFSAGGHLAACTGTLWNHSCLDEYLSGDRTPYKPNTMVLSYPVINPLHRGSYLNLFEKKEEALTEEVIDLLSLEKQVTKDTPPTFLWHNSDDKAVPVACSLMFGMALYQNGIPFEMRIWENGGHGVCLGNYVTKSHHTVEHPLDCCGWVAESVKFLLRH